MISLREVQKKFGARVAVELPAEQQSVHVGPYDDLNFQATTRGGRVMDHILANKAVFKSATDTAGNVAIVGGAITALEWVLGGKSWIAGAEDGSISAWFRAPAGAPPDWS